MKAVKNKRPLPREDFKEVVELRSRGHDPRVDPLATQKISREDLDEALRRTKSGVREATRRAPAARDPRLDLADIPGPVAETTTEAPRASERMPVTFVAPEIESEAVAAPVAAEPVAVAPRAAALPLLVPAGVSLRSVLVLGVLLASIVGFLAGRLLNGPP